MNIRKLLICIAFSSLFLPAVFSQQNKNINENLSDFSCQLRKIISNATSQQNIFSDAWIGYLVPGDKMNFQIGIEGALTQINMDDLLYAAKAIHIGSVPETYAYPTLGINAKMGGIFLPFDLGLSFFTIDTRYFSELSKGIYLNMFVIGGDFRIAILQDKKYFPAWSIGCAYFYSKGGIGCGNEYNGIDVEYSTHTIIAETQLSKRISFLTPFIGYKAIFSNSENNYFWQNETGIQVNGVLTKKGQGKSTIDFLDSFSSQIFAGIGFSLGMFQLDTSASYNITDQIFNGAVSLRMKL